MITLQTFGPGMGLPEASPFVLKTLIQMKMSGLDFEVKSGMSGFRKAPKGKLPFITDGGKVIADSTLIQDHLERTYGIDFDRGHDARDRAIAYGIQKMLEESVYFALVQRRWIRPDGWAVVQKELLGGIPGFVAWFIVPRLQKKVAATLHAQGTGRHTDAEIDMIAERGFKAVADLMGDRPWLLGDAPCAADATALAFMLAASTPMLPGAMRDSVMGRPNLAAYVARGKKQFFPDFVFA
jgi:glutathione S-transferase